MRKLIQKKRPRIVRRRVKRSNKGVSLAVKKYVKTSIHKNVENKIVNINSGDNFGNVNNTPALSAYPMMPYSGYWTISQSVGQNGRIGNEITMRKVTLNYVLRPQIYNATSNPYVAPFHVDLFLGYIKRSPALIPSTGDIGLLFQNGNSAIAPAGNLNDLISDVNKDYWVIKKRWRHKIGCSNNQGTGSTAPASAQFQYFANNDFQLNVVKKMDITKLLPTKKIRFNDSDATSQKNLFFFYQAVYADGSTSTSAIEMAHIDFWIKFEYEDA